MTVHYGYDEKGRLTGERQTVHHPQTEALLWQHETRHAYNAQGLANRCIPDNLPAVEWLTYGSGYGRDETRRHTAGGVHPRPPAPGNAAQLRPL